MAMKNTPPDFHKVTITLPAAVWTRLNELIPARQRSRFIAQVLEEQLVMAEQQLALQETAGAWLDEDHPDMQGGAAIDQWLDTLRQSWTVSGESERG